LGAEYGFVWALMSADPDSPRCRTLSRIEGIDDIREQIETDPTHIVLAGHVAGDAIEIELANLLIGFTRHKPVDVAESASLLATVCERLKELQFYDGESRVESFEKDGSNGGASSTPFWTVIRLGTTGER